MFRYSLALMVGVGLAVAGEVRAANNLAALFDEQVHDFGSVPVGPLLQHTFTYKNKTNQNLRAVSARVSCGCVHATADGKVVPPGGTGSVHATMDTKRFVGAKQVTIFVLFEGHPQEVQLSVTAFGRTDIQLSPDNLAFGLVRKGAGATANMTLSFYGPTKVTEAACDSGYVQLSMKESQQSAGGTTYALSAKLRSDIPVGRWYTDVWVKTNQGGNDRIRIPVSVDVEPALLVTPGAVQFDTARAGAAEPVKKQVFVRGSQPFRILEVKGGDDVFTASAASTEARPVHILTVQFKPGKEGEFAKTLQIVTDLKDDNQVEVPVKGKAQ